MLFAFVRKNEKQNGREHGINAIVNRTVCERRSIWFVNWTFRVWRTVHHTTYGTIANCQWKRLTLSQVRCAVRCATLTISNEWENIRGLHTSHTPTGRRCHRRPTARFVSLVFSIVILFVWHVAKATSELNRMKNAKHFFRLLRSFVRFAFSRRACVCERAP